MRHAASSNDTRDKVKVTETENGTVILKGYGVRATSIAHKVANRVAEKFGLESSHCERDARILGAEGYRVAHAARVQINNHANARVK